MARRAKSQARRNQGNSNALPGWAWMVLGIVLTVGVILAVPRLLERNGEDGFFRPKPNPDAQPVAESGDAEEIEASEEPAPAAANTKPAQPEEPQYDFYELLPGEEVALSDAQLAAAAREEQARARLEQQRLAQQQAAGQSDPSRPQPLPESGNEAATPTTATTTSPTTASSVPATSTTATTTAPGKDTPYVLQAGAFGASGDAEAAKAKIALLGLNARVESAQIGGKTVYRVRMGPYGTASELAAAKGKLSSGGLPAMAIKAK